MKPIRTRLTFCMRPEFEALILDYARANGIGIASAMRTLIASALEAEGYEADCVAPIVNGYHSRFDHKKEAQDANEPAGPSSGA
jgi:hypothetical protein